MLTDDDLAVWVAGLDDLFALVAGRFGRVEPRRRARAYVRGLLAPLAVKNGWTLAEAAGDATPDGMQRLLNAAAWDADGVRDDVRGYVARHLGSADGVLVVDETGFLKKGARSAGVQRQYSGTAGRIENCQLGVFLAYATGKGRALVDRELYLPKSWTDDRDRCRDAAVPDDVQFATKPELARLMLGRALDAGVPAAWVTADEAYGRDGKFRGWLEQRRIGYVVAVDSRQAITGDAGTSRADALAAHAPDQAWKRRSCGNGSKGPRVFDWASATLPADGTEKRVSYTWRDAPTRGWLKFQFRLACLRIVSDEPGAAGEQQGDLVSRLRAAVEAKDAENSALRARLEKVLARLDAALTEAAAEREQRERLDWHDGNHPGYALGSWLRDYNLTFITVAGSAWS